MSKRNSNFTFRTIRLLISDQKQSGQVTRLRYRHRDPHRRTIRNIHPRMVRNREHQRQRLFAFAVIPAQAGTQTLIFGAGSRLSPG